MGFVRMVICCSLLFSGLATKGNAQNFSCDSNLSQPLCPGIITKCTCTTTSSSNQWRFPTLDLCPNTSNTINLAQGGPCSVLSPSSTGTCGPYLSAVNNNPGLSSARCPSSILTITANQTLHGLVIECRDARIGDETTIGNRTITIEAPPVTPTITVINTSLNWFTVILEPLQSTTTSCNVSVNGSAPVSLPASASYNGRIIDRFIILESIPSNGTMPFTINFSNVTNTTFYSISVVAVNCAGSSMPRTITIGPDYLPGSSSTPSGSHVAVVGAVLMTLIQLLMGT